MKIGFFGVGEDDKKSFFRANLAEYELVFIDTVLNKENLPPENDFEVISVNVDCKIDSFVIDYLPQLKFICTRSTGFDNVETNYAKSKHIGVSNVPDYGSHTVAEFAFGLILSLFRKLPQSYNRIKEDQVFSFNNLRGSDLFGKTLGVVGTGKIGANVIKIAKGFDMQVLGFDLFPNQHLALKLGFEYTSLEALLKQSEVVSLHVPYNEKTHHLINSENIVFMNKQAFLVNTSRGAVIETKALIQAFEENQIAGAALDVLEDEDEFKKQGKPTEDDLKLINMPQVIITPHMAFYTKEAENAIQETTLKNILSFITGLPINIINTETS